MNKGKYIVACIKEVKPSVLVCDYSSWLSKQLNIKLKLLHTIEQETSGSASDLSGSIGLDSGDELLDQLVELEHEQNKVLQQKAKLILESVKRRAIKNGITEPKLCLRHGSLQENLLDLKEDIEVIVMGRYGPINKTSGTHALSSKVEQAIRSIEKPIFVISKPFEKPTKALFAYDGSANANKALSYIIDSKILNGLEIHIVYVGEKNETSIGFIEAANSKFKALNYKVIPEYLSGNIDEALVSYISNHNISMTVMGAFGKHWIRELLMGSFTSKMLNCSEKPLLLVR